MYTVYIRHLETISCNYNVNELTAVREVLKKSI